MLKTGVTTTLAALVLLSLAACGNTAGERGLTGAGMGAAGGAAVGSATGGDPATGAILGGAAGAAAGVLTDEDDLDIGEPVWE